MNNVTLLLSGVDPMYVFKSENELKLWVKENLISRQDAAELTGQSYTAFSQTLRSERGLKPFVEYKNSDGKILYRLFLKSDVLAYAERVKENRNRSKKKET